MNHSIQPPFIALKEVPGTIKKLVSDCGAGTFVGSMMTTKGVYVVLFSHRLNREFSLVVAGNAMGPVVSKVYEALAT